MRFAVDRKDRQIILATSIGLSFVLIALLIRFPYSAVFNSSEDVKAYNPALESNRSQSFTSKKKAVAKENPPINSQLFPPRNIDLPIEGRIVLQGGEATSKQLYFLVNEIRTNKNRIPPGFSKDGEMIIKPGVLLQVESLSTPREGLKEGKDYLMYIRFSPREDGASKATVIRAKPLW